MPRPTKKKTKRLRKTQKRRSVGKRRTFRHKKIQKKRQSNNMLGANYMLGGAGEINTLEEPIMAEVINVIPNDPPLDIGIEHYEPLCFNLTGDIVLLTAYRMRKLVCFNMNTNEKTFIENTDLSYNKETIAISPNGQYIVALNKTHVNGLIVSTATGEVVHILNGGNPSTIIWCLAFSPDGNFVATGFQDARIIIWSTATGQAVKNLVGQLDPVTVVAFSPDGLYIVSGGRDDGVLRMWMIETGEIVRTFGVQEFHVTCVTFSPDGRYFVSDAKSSLKIWSTETGENVRTLNSRPEDVYLNQKNIGFSPDGKYIVSIGEYKTVNIWSFTTGNLLKTLGQFENTPQICGLYDPQTYTPFTYTLKIGFSDNLSTYSVIEETSRNKLITTRLSNSEMPTDARLPGRIWDYIESFNKK